MPACCVLKCRARKSKSQPQLTLHRFPRNEGLRKKWIEAIGEENINHRVLISSRCLCSLHFEEDCFNRTLDVIRLRDDSVPSIFQENEKKPHRKSIVLPKTSSIQKSNVSSTSTVIDSLPHRIVESVNKVPDKKQNEEDSFVLCEPNSIQKSDVSCTPIKIEIDPLELSRQIVDKEIDQIEKNKSLEEKCVQQQHNIKRLNETIRKKNKQIADLKDIIKDLQRKNCINKRQAVVMGDLAIPRDFLRVYSK